MEFCLKYKHVLEQQVAGDSDVFMRKHQHTTFEIIIYAGSESTPHCAQDSQDPLWYYVTLLSLTKPAGIRGITG